MEISKLSNRKRGENPPRLSFKLDAIYCIFWILTMMIFQDKERNVVSYNFPVALELIDPVQIRWTNFSDDLVLDIFLLRTVTVTVSKNRHF